MFKRIKFFVEKVFRDFLLTCYDDDKFEFISLPRVQYFLSSLAVLVTWIWTLAGGHFEYWDKLLAWNGTGAAGYIAKKFADKGQVKP